MNSEEIAEMAKKMAGWPDRSRELFLKVVFSFFEMYVMTDEEIGESEGYSWIEMFAAP